MKIAVDKAQKDGKHTLKHQQIESLGYELVFLPLPVGDYILIDDDVAEVVKRRGDRLKKMDLLAVSKASVDTKYGIEEIYGDIIGKSQHARFRDECILAQQNRINFTVLIESAPQVASLEDMNRWKNWNQLYAYCRRNGIQTGQGMMARIDDYVAHGGQKPPVSGEQLAKAMRTMQDEYGFRFRFCCPDETGAEIVRLLTEGRDQ